MGIIDYYKLAFSGRQTSFSEHVQQADAVISRLVESIPEIIFIEDKKLNKEFAINLMEDNSISTHEYVLLQKLFYQYSVVFEDTVSFKFQCQDGNVYEAEEFFNKNTGILRLLKSVLFLDFYNSLDLVYGVFSLYDMIPFLDLKTIPLSDKKDALLNQKRYISEKIRDLSGQYDVLNIEYVNYSNKVAQFEKLIHEIQVKASVDESKSQDPVLVDASNYKSKLLKFKNAHRRISERVENAKVNLDDLKINMRNPDLQRVLSSLLKKWTKKEKSISDNIKLMSVEVSNYDDILKRGETTIAKRQGEFNKKINDLKEKLASAINMRDKLYDRVVEIKNSSNSLQMELQSIENRISSEVTLVDADKLVSRNIVSIDKEITPGEKLFRFLSNYFISVDQSNFLSIIDRRTLILKLFPSIKIKSISIIDGAIDEKNFITVD